MQAFFWDVGLFFSWSLHSLRGAHGGVLKVCWGVVSRLREQILVWFMPEMRKWVKFGVQYSSPCPDLPTDSLSMLELVCTLIDLHCGEQHLPQERGCACVVASLWDYLHESLHLN